MSAGITRRQQEALDWLSRVGKASETTVRKAGFSTQTFEALIRARLVDWRVVGIARPKTVYVAKEES